MIIGKYDKKLVEIKNRAELMEDKYLQIASEIVANVRKYGDRALFDYTNKFDNYQANASNVIVSDVELALAFKYVSEDLIVAIESAKSNILAFHMLQVEKTWLSESDNNVILGQKITPIENVGVYVPGGKANYFSSVLMNVLPAVAAGVKNIVIATPANNGVVSPVLLVAARLCGVSKVYKMGGAQSIAALAYGTDSVKKVDKITGPGNIYVAMAKKLVFGKVDIDMIAGPSEILIIADDEANPEFVAADMLAQCEHDELASAVCITISEDMAKRVEIEVRKQLELLPKKDIAAVSMEKFSAIVVVDSLDEACEIANDIAPEHLELYVKSPMDYLYKIKHAGAIFLGENSPEAIGDYYAGPNHVLPTGGTARFFSPLGTYDFIKRSSIIYYSKEQLKIDATNSINMAVAENLEGHANSIRLRTK